MTASSSTATDRGPRTAYYLLQTYYLRNSTQLPRIHEFMSQGLLPAANRIHDGPKIFLEGLIASHMPQLSVIIGLHSLDEFSSLASGLRKDEGFQKAFAAWENGPEPPYEHFSQSLLKTAVYSPEIDSRSRASKPRIFELRVYHSPTWKQLAALNERFAGPEIKIFHRVGIHPILYSETVMGQNMPNLTYLIPFENLAAREKAWDAFGGDPEWVKVRKESIETHGQISSVIQMSLYRTTAYSPVA